MLATHTHTHLHVVCATRQKKALNFTESHNAETRALRHYCAKNEADNSLLFPNLVLTRRETHLNLEQQLQCWIYTFCTQVQHEE